MNIVNHRLFAAALSLIILAGHAQVSEANDGSTNSVKQLHALTFNAGQKRAVGYFTAGTGKCRLVLTLAQSETGADDGFQATRFEISIPETQTRKYVADGQTFEFTCSQDAEEMTFKRLSMLTSAGEQ